MSHPQPDAGTRHHELIRIGGIAVLLGLALHIVLNNVIKQWPPDDPTQAEFQAYLSAEASSWAIVHGLRYVAFACIAVFAAALFARTCCTRAVRPTGWGIVGLLGTSVLVTNGVITNGVETLAFLEHGYVAGRQELFWLLFRVTRVLFTAEIAAWGILILGFSIAGWRSATLPRWLAGFGCFSATACMLAGVFVVSILSDGPAVPLIDVAALTGLAWFACVGVYMVWRGDS